MTDSSYWLSQFHWTKSTVIRRSQTVSRSQAAADLDIQEPAAIVFHDRWSHVGTSGLLSGTFPPSTRRLNGGDVRERFLGNVKSRNGSDLLAKSSAIMPSD